MRAAVMAGGAGTRLRPLTSGTPKPLLPVAGRPLLERNLLLLREHGITEVVITVQYLAALIRSQIGTGEELGMHVTYATESQPLGTAGSVRNAIGALGDEPFIVLSGDALTDFDLTTLIETHHRTGAAATVALARRQDPVEFGLVVTDSDGRVIRFVEKPDWSEVFTDTVNTGVYVISPEVLEGVKPDVEVDFSRDVFPALLADGRLVQGQVLDGYWEDIGNPEAYLRVQADVLSGLVRTPIDGFQVSPGIWLGEGAEVSDRATLVPPVLIGQNVRVEPGARIGDGSVIGANAIVRSGARVERSLLHDNVFIGHQASVSGAVVGRSSEVLRSAQMDAGSIVAEGCTVDEEAIIGAGVRVFPHKTIEAGATVTESVIWESGGHRTLFGPRGVSGIVNVDITPELVVQLGVAYASTLPKGSSVTVARDHSKAARAMNRALVGALTASALGVRDLRTRALPIARHDVADNAVGGIVLRTTDGEPDRLDVVLLDASGSDLPSEQRSKVERVFVRRDYRRPFPEEIGDIITPNRVLDDYLSSVVENTNTAGIVGSGLKIVVDCGAGAAALTVPELIGRLEVDALLTNAGPVESRPTLDESARKESLRQLGDLVASSGSAFGVSLDSMAERLWLVDEAGTVIPDDRALLVLLDLAAAERRTGAVVVPMPTTSVAEQVAGFHDVDLRRASGDRRDLLAACRRKDFVLGGDGRGGFVVPMPGGRVAQVDALAMLAHLIGLVARTNLTLSAIDARIPPSHVRHEGVQVPWAFKGAAMRAVWERAEGHTSTTSHGVRVVEPDGAWVFVEPAADRAAIEIWAEGDDDERSRQLLEQWGNVVREALNAAREGQP